MRGLELGTNTVPFDDGVVGKNLEATVASRDCVGAAYTDAELPVVDEEDRF